MPKPEQLARLVEKKDFQKAAEFCRAAWAERTDPLFWETQLGYVLFLDDQSVEHLTLTIPVFHDLVAKAPQDPNAHFWLGYTMLVLTPSFDESMQRAAIEMLQKTITLDPEHPYAHLVLSNSPRIEEETRIQHLRRVLRIQRVNIRAYVTLVDLLLKTRQRTEAKQVFTEFHQVTAFAETDYGIMNDYINGVFTWFNQASEKRRATEERLRKRIGFLS